MRTSKKIRLSELKGHIQNNPRHRLTNAPGEMELLHAALQEECKREHELKSNLTRLQSMLKEETDMQQQLKLQLMAHADCEQLPKFRLVVDPLVFASERISDEVKQFALKTQNSILHINQISRQQCRQVEMQFAGLDASRADLNEVEDSLVKLEEKTALERVQISAKLALQTLRLSSAEQQREMLEADLSSIDSQLQSKMQEYSKTCQNKEEMERQASQLRSDINSYNEEIELLEEAATDQNELARRMVQMELLKQQLDRLQCEYKKEMRRHAQLSSRGVTALRI